MKAIGVARKLERIDELIPFRPRRKTSGAIGGGRRRYIVVELLVRRGSGLSFEVESTGKVERRARRRRAREEEARGRE